MFFTLYYMAATWLQSWRLRTISSKISQHIKEKSSICFYNISTTSSVINLPNVSSELCTNHSQARVKDILWYFDQQRGCILLPLQKINLGPWITFPSTNHLIPFEFQNYNNASFDKNTEKIFLLIETDVIPNFNIHDNFMIETFGLPIAWKIDSHLAILLKTDIQHLTELITSSFMRNCYLINDKLRLSRIESVIIEGEPQPYDLLKNHLSKELLNRSVRFLNKKQWEKHLNGLRSLGVLANQAIEYEQTNEGKKNFIKPDLIPLKTVEEIIVTKQTPSTSKNPPKEEIIGNTEISEYKPNTPIHIEKNVPLEKAIVSELPSTPILVEKNVPSDKLKVKKKIIPQSIEKVVPSKQPEKIVLPKKVEKVVSPKLPAKNLLSKKVEKPLAITPKKNLDFKCTKIVSQKTNEKSIKPKNVENEKKKTVEKNDDKLYNADKLSGTQRPSLKRTKGNTIINKPPNILVYSDSLVTRDNVITTLNRILDKNMYTIYPLTKQQVKTKIWFDNTILLVVCGTITDDIKNILLDYFLIGGKMFSLCSDLLNIVLPNYHTAEVREHELVQFSYGKWNKIKMMHHVFCYQPSPVRKHFSHDGEEPQTPQIKSIMMCPRFVEVKDQQGVLHYLQVEVLGTEETWNTPSLMLANNSKNGGRAVFSQVHLETDPTLYEADEIKYNILKNSDNERLEILTDILSTQLDMSVTKILNEKNNAMNLCGYFLGRHESKYKFLEKLSDITLSNSENQIKNKYFNIKFLDKKLTETNNFNRNSNNNNNYLPILINSCPDNFSTVDYFENLKTEHIGRLVIYTPIITSTMNILSELTLSHGLVIIAREQTIGSGRNDNQWLSPEGCCMFSIQLHIPFASPLGQRIPLVQHLIGISIINSILKMDGYGDLDINIKWPNDIYYNGNIKIGGLIINSLMNSTNAICNIGCGINLNNNKPTTCINNIINDYNIKNDKNLNLINYENYLALILTEIELLYNQIQNGDLKILYDLYYKYWLHSNAEVTIMDENAGEKRGKIIGIDDFGYLLVQIDGQIKPETVHPDGNSFDMLHGLILPK